MTHDEFVAELRLVQPSLEVIGHYINNGTKVEVKDSLGVIKRFWVFNWPSC
jgi:hypothetical protein